MTSYMWSKTAADTATLVHKTLKAYRHGIILIPFPDEGIVVAWVFANHHEGAHEEVRRQLTTARYCIRKTQVKELGFGISQDGGTWAWVGKTDACCRTQVGRQFQLEMLANAISAAVEGGLTAIREPHNWLISEVSYTEGASKPVESRTPRAHLGGPSAFGRA